MEDKYYTGIEGNITVYNPQVKEGQTYAQVYVQNGVNEDYFNLIATGWMVKFLFLLIILILTFDALQLVFLYLYIYIYIYIRKSVIIFHNLYFF